MRPKIYVKIVCRITIRTPYTDYEVNDGTEEAQAYFDEAEKQLAALDAEMDLLNKVGEKLSDIRPGDVLATATLSPEARGVYHYLLSEMGKGNKDVKKSARVSALIAARMTDRLVAFHREAGDNDYTAMDALPELLANAGEAAQEKEAAQLRQEEVQSQKEAVRKQYKGTEMRMKAPNGKPTNLTEEQWLLVRTPAFKAWFGDWEYIANAYPSVTAKERIEAKEILKTLRNKDLVSRDENIVARISKEGRSKLVSDAALHKSQKNGFSIEEHYTAVANIKKLFEASVRSQVKEDKNKEITAFESFSAPIMFENGIAIATLSVKVTKEAKTGRSIYSIELMELKKSGGTIPSQVQKPTSDTPDLSILNISKIADKVNATSKVVDENGEPKVVYHGTKRKDRVGNEFRKDRATSGPMAYFTDAFEIAESYSQDKEDTSQESLPYEDQFRIKTAEGADIPLYKHWTRLPLAKRQEIAEKAKHITQDDDGNIIYDETEENGLGNFAYQMKEAHGNAIRALEEGWLNDGTLYQEEGRFFEVLKLAGVEEEGLFYADPNFTAAGVFSVFMAMKNPFNTMGQVTKGFLRSLRAAAKKAPKAENPRSFDL